MALDSCMNLQEYCLQNPTCLLCKFCTCFCSIIDKRFDVIRRLSKQFMFEEYCIVEKSTESLQMIQWQQKNPQKQESKSKGQNIKHRC